jgi:hypothetical protein
VRGAIMVVLALDAWRVLRDPLENGGLFGGLTIAIHEGGHVLFGFFSEWLMVAGGSLAQLLAPITVAAILYYKQRDRLGAVLMSFWLATSMASMSVYIGDARALELPLISLGDGGDDGVQHDWEYLLQHAHLLNSDLRIADTVHRLAWTIWLVAIITVAAMIARVRSETSALRQPASSSL